MVMTFDLEVERTIHNINFHDTTVAPLPTLSPPNSAVWKMGFTVVMQLAITVNQHKI